ncbi:MAG: lipopolysaccharide biosynthesis protein [Steroidobacteraceae bacterium]
MSEAGTRGVFVRMFGSAIAMQALLSATNFLVGLVLIRHVSNTEYGYFILITNAALLISGLQNAFIQPPMILRMTRSSESECADIVGGLFRGQRRILGLLAAAALSILTLLWLADIIDNQQGLLGIATIAVLATALYREFFRMVLLAYRRSHDVLKADAGYVVVVLIGIPLATLTKAPAAAAVIALSLAAIVGGYFLTRSLARYAAWNPDGPSSMLREMAPLGTWSALGSGTHWAFSQGYNYVVAGSLDVSAVAALAATRLLMMPVNLLSSGISSLMMPTSTAWLNTHGAAKLFRRLILIASALGALALCYFVTIWFLRGFIFTNVMHKQFAQSDILVATWSAVFLVMLFRDQLQFLPGASGLYRPLMAVTGTSAIISLSTGYEAIRHFGVVGAPFGVLLGELCNVAGIIYLSMRKIRTQRSNFSSVQ